jgi:hypothetical protein
MPHLEDVAEDNYTQINNDNWGSDAHFIHWEEHSDDPVVCYINTCTISEEDPDTVAKFGTNDTAYWLQYVPKHYHQHSVVFFQDSFGEDAYAQAVQPHH